VLWRVALLPYLSTHFVACGRLCEHSQDAQWHALGCWIGESGTHFGRLLSVVLLIPDVWMGAAFPSMGDFERDKTGQEHRCVNVTKYRMCISDSGDMEISTIKSSAPIISNVQSLRDLPNLHSDICRAW
jgi:hypothetical protein